MRCDSLSTGFMSNKPIFTGFWGNNILIEFKCTNLHITNKILDFTYRKFCFGENLGSFLPWCNLNQTSPIFLAFFSPFLLLFVCFYSKGSILFVGVILFLILIILCYFFDCLSHLFTFTDADSETLYHVILLLFFLFLFLASNHIHS